MKIPTLALVGNPNAGKTTLFNALTHSSQYVGNWPGVTVERKEGTLRGESFICNVIDLPGIYSLSPFSPEELITRTALLEQSPDLIVNILDATNLERSLYLTTQLMELGRPMILALNMMDEMRGRGRILDAAGLREDISVPVVCISAGKGEGMDALLREISDFFREKKTTTLPPVHRYPDNIEKRLSAIEIRISASCKKANVPVRFAAVKLFEGDSAMEALFAQKHEKPDSAESDDYRAVMIADGRYAWIGGIVRRHVYFAADDRTERITKAIDRVVTHRVLALPIYAALMLLILFFTFGPPGNALTDFFQTAAVQPTLRLMDTLLEALGTADWLHSLVTGGILSGVGGVLSFLPQIALLFFFLSVLEDSGYMARATFIMDQLLRKIGLSGKAFAPLMMGFGCSTPAILATRTLESEAEKKLTILLTPFFSCSAKMPVYALFVLVFFRNHALPVILSLYLMGVLLGVLSALLFRKTILPGQSSAYVMELPPYRRPNAAGIARQVWNRVRDFIIKVTTVMLLCSVVIWFLQNFTPAFQKIDPAADMELSLLVRIGQWIAPIFAPLGFDSWQAAVALLAGFAAKETVVTSLQILYHGGDFHAGLAGAFTPLAAYSYLVFILLYTPCVSAVTTAWKEFRSASWTVFMVLYQCLLAWLASCAVYQLGRWMGL